MCDAALGLLPDAQPFSPGAVAARGWGREPVDAVASDDARAPVSRARFKAFPIQEDDHLLTVLRYVERNPFRAGLVRGVADWPWSSLRLHTEPDRPAWYSDGPVRRGRGWLAHVAEPQTDAELVALRRSVERGVPYGSAPWQKKTIAKLGLESTLRPRGRPRKAKQ